MVLSSADAGQARSVAAVARGRARDLRALAHAEERATASLRARSVRRVAGTVRAASTPRRGAQVSAALGAAGRRTAVALATAGTGVAGALRVTRERASAARARRKARVADESGSDAPRGWAVPWGAIGQASAAAIIAFGLVVGTYAGVQAIVGREGNAVAAPASSEVTPSAEGPSPSAPAVERTSAPVASVSPSSSPALEASQGAPCDEEEGPVDGCTPGSSSLEGTEDFSGEYGDPGITLLPAKYPVSNLSVSADGSTLVYVEREPSGWEGIEHVYAMNLATRKTVALPFPGVAHGQIAVSPDGKWAASGYYDTLCSTQSGACVDIGGGGNVYDFGIRWSPDSSQYVITMCQTSRCSTNDLSGYRVAIVDATTKAVAIVSDGFGARWSNDGTRLAWLRDSDGDGLYGVWVKVDDGGDAQALTPEVSSPEKYAAQMAGAESSQDDGRLAFPMNVGGVRAVGVVGSGGESLGTVAGVSDRDPIRWLGWSADGAYLAVRAGPIDGTPPSGTLYVAPTSTLSAASLNAPGMQIARNPVWSPAGHRLDAPAGAFDMADSWFTWVTWNGGTGKLMPQGGACLTGPQGALLVPRSDGGTPTQAVGRFSCAESSAGFYQVDLGALASRPSST